MFELKGKVAIVTGARRGIGKGIAEVFASAGAKVVISDISQKDCEKTAKAIEKKYKTKAIGLVCDVSDEAQVNDLVDVTLKKFKRLDIMVNNAGVFFSKPVLKYTEEDWNKIINIDLKGVFLCSKAAARVMSKKKRGKIINIASIAGLVGYLGGSAYCAAKGGIITMTKEMALEFAPMGINVNAIAPGAIETPMTAFMKKDKKLLKQTLAGVPLGRMGKPNEIGYGALYLASDESNYVTGHTLVIDGGWVSH